MRRIIPALALVLSLLASGILAQAPEKIDYSALAQIGRGGHGRDHSATGSGAMMEAMRILKAIGAKPRRTIRIALWGGEEEGLLGSRAYVREHFGDPSTMALKPDHAKVAAYFNSDNGTGRVRGIWLQGNLATAAVFEEWIKPLRDLGVVALGPRSVASTDHASFDAVVSLPTAPQCATRSCPASRCRFVRPADFCERRRFRVPGSRFQVQVPGSRFREVEAR